MNENRADNFLRLIRRSQRGKLKIYVGYSAGVGKTYQMLLEGHRILEDGIDLVVGLVETHGRTETEALLTGIPIIPLRKITYHGIAIEEMDIDAILARRPSIVLVDELAHTNVPGSRNVKRYQDVEELLAAGIHVISTLNIQHLESLYDTVEKATAVKVRERVPDRIIAEADQLVNVDVTIEDLRRRLEEGKVYTKERIDTAMANFFKPTNLEQLRELTLRELAAQIDSRRRDPLDDDIPSSPDQVMVCLSSRGPNGEALLRYASRLAGRLNRNWYAVYVQTAKEHPTVIDATTQRMLSNTLMLAQQLGATVFTFKGDDVVKTILQFAKEYLVGHIVIGSPTKGTPFWKRLLGQTSIIERLVTEGRGITVVVLDTKLVTEDQHKCANSEVQSENHLERKAFVYENKTAFLHLNTLIWNELVKKEDVVKQMLDSFSQTGKAVKSRALTALFEREKQGGTLVGDDAIVAHAKIEGLTQPLIALGVCKKGIHDNSFGQELKIIVLLLSPANSTERHLELLSITSKMLRDDILRKTILSARDTRVVKETVQRWVIEMWSSESVAR